jgi:hypothetical protein
MDVDIVFIVLAVTSSSVVGLLAIWAALGRGHWFLRVATLGAVIGLALLIPAYELIVVYTVQCLVVVPTLIVARRLRARGEGNHVLQFTLLDLLLLAAVVAVLTAVGVSVPRRVWESWGLLYAIPTFFGATATPPCVDYLVTGLIGGLVTLAAAWLALGCQRRWIRWILFLLCTASVTGTAGAMVHWRMEGRARDIMSGRILVSGVYLLASPYAVTLILLLPLVPMTACLAMFRVQASLRDASFRRRRAVALVLLTLLGLGVLVPPSWTFYMLMTPPPIPNDPLPEPNGYDTLLLAGKQLENVTVPDDDKNLPEAERASPKDYREFYSKYYAVGDDVHAALDNGCRVPLKYNASDVDGYMEVRQLAYAMVAQGDAASTDGDVAVASRYYRDTIRLGKAYAHGGLAMHWLVGVAVEYTGLHAVHAQRDSMTTSARREWIAAIPALAVDFEPSEECCERDAIWTQNACGWQRQLIWLAGQYSGHRTQPTLDAMERQRCATYRILLVELALAEYRSNHGAYPKELAALAPDVLKEVPMDSFSEEPLVYRPRDKDYTLYSVGRNGKDDGGGEPDPANPTTWSDDIGFW